MSEYTDSHSQLVIYRESRRKFFPATFSSGRAAHSAPNKTDKPLKLLEKIYFFFLNFFMQLWLWPLFLSTFSTMGLASGSLPHTHTHTQELLLCAVDKLHYDCQLINSFLFSTSICFLKSLMCSCVMWLPSLQAIWHKCVQDISHTFPIIISIL